MSIETRNTIENCVWAFCWLAFIVASLALFVLNADHF